MFHFTSGLRVIAGFQGPVFTNQLKSSGSGDSFSITIGAILFSIPVLIKLVRFKSKLNSPELWFLFSMFVVQIFYLCLIEAGSIIETITISSNYILALWLTALTLVPFYVFSNLSKIKST